MPKIDPIVRAITVGFGSVVASNLLGKGISTALEAGFKAIAPMFASNAVRAAAAGEASAAAGGTAAATGVVARVASKAVPALGLLTVAQMSGDSPGQQAAAAAGNDALIQSGRRKEVKHFFGLLSTYEDVPPDQPASAASGNTGAKIGATQQPQDVKVTIVNATGMPLNVVNAEKGNAGRQ